MVQVSTVKWFIVHNYSLKLGIIFYKTEWKWMMEWNWQYWKEKLSVISLPESKGQPRKWFSRWGCYILLSSFFPSKNFCCISQTAVIHNYLSITLVERILGILESITLLLFKTWCDIPCLSRIFSLASHYWLIFMDSHNPDGEKLPTFLEGMWNLTWPMYVHAWSSVLKAARSISSTTSGEWGPWAEMKMEF